MAVIEEKMENQHKTKKLGLLGIFATTNGYEVRLLDETCRKPDCTECGIGRITEARHKRTAFIAAKKALVRMGYTHLALMGSRYVRRLPSYLGKMTNIEFKEWRKSQEAADALQGVPPLTTGAAAAT